MTWVQLSKREKRTGKRNKLGDLLGSEEDVARGGAAGDAANSAPLFAAFVIGEWWGSGDGDFGGELEVDGRLHKDARQNQQ